MLYFLLLIVFVALIAGPIIVGRMSFLQDALKPLSSGALKDFGLIQIDWDQDDTLGETETGLKNPSYSGAADTISGFSTPGIGVATSAPADRMMFF